MSKDHTLPDALNAALHDLFGLDAETLKAEYIAKGFHASQPVLEALGEAMAIAYPATKGREPDGESEEWSSAWREVDAAWGTTSTMPLG